MIRKKTGRKSPGQKNTRKRGRKLLNYGVELLALILLIMAAFFTPQIIFQIQDRILCGDTVLGQRESINVEALSATYEKSLTARMMNFAEGMADEEKFYLSSQELEITDEVRDYVKGDTAFFQDFIYMLMDAGMLYGEFWGYDITVWKQYVIYSDNYARGVNFILWYIEMENEYGERVKLLADAEDGTLYAVKAEDNIRMWERDDMPYEYYAIIYGGDYAAGELWIWFMVYYGGMNANSAGLLQNIVSNTGYTLNHILEAYPFMEEIPQEELHYYFEKYGIDAGSVGIEVDEAGNKELDLFQSSDITVGKNAGYLIRDMGDVSYLLPFGKGCLEVVMETGNTDELEKLLYQNIYKAPDIIIGIREIYEMIPEFILQAD